MIASDVSTNPVAQLAEQHLDIARSVALRLKRHFTWIDMEDLHNYSLWGLTRAASAYLPERGIPFPCFASQKAFFLAIDAMREDKVVCRSTKGQVSASRARHSSLSANCPLSDEVADGHAADEMRRLEAKDLLASLLSRLDDRDRQLLLLHYADGMTFKEIARVFDRSESAVFLRHRSLIAKLRRFAGVSETEQPMKATKQWNAIARS
ncbi:MAG: sigma-70 family RNA polymerase sigma factor [Phycisphaerae bacterium]|nr:sigma-70 family RNA polymerase sigma factor [Phycisphaerae bacterium]